MRKGHLKRPKGLLVSTGKSENELQAFSNRLRSNFWHNIPKFRGKLHQIFSQFHCNYPFIIVLTRSVLKDNCFTLVVSKEHNICKDN